MRILPIITAIAVSFLSVACSTPARRRASPWSVLRRSALSGYGMKSPALTTLLKAGWKSHDRGTHVMTAVWMW